MNVEKDDKKWLDEYPALKQVNPAYPFKVPEGYFEQLGEMTMNMIRLADFKLKFPGEGFSVPENYFNELEQNIRSRIAIDEVLNQKEGFTVPVNYFDQMEQNIGSRIALDNILGQTEGFKVPANYFDELSQNIQSRISIDEVLNQKDGLTVPANYFNNLGQNIQSRVAIDEVLNQNDGFNVPVNYFDELEQNIESRINIEGMVAVDGFTVPEGYFTGLEARILNQTVSKPGEASEKQYQQGVVRKLWASSAFKYASAACFSIVMGAAIFATEFNSESQHKRSYLHRELSKIPKSDIESYLELNADSPSIMDNVDPDNLDLVTSEYDGQQKN